MTGRSIQIWVGAGLALAVSCTAIALWGRATPTDRTAAGGRDDPLHGGAAADSPLARANGLLAVGDLEGALAAYEELSEKARATADSRLLADSLSGLGLVYKRLGDYHLAVTLYSSALKTCRTLDGLDCQAETLHNLGSCYTLLGELAMARDTLENALGLWPPGSYERSSTLTALATLDDLEGDHDLAIERFREALVLRRVPSQANVKKGRQGLGATLDRLATAYRQAGRVADARRTYEEALEIWREGGLRAQLGVTQSNLGWLYVERRQPAVALEYFSRAVPLLEEARNSNALAHALLGMAQAHRQRMDLSAAAGLLDRATGIVESLRSTSYSHLLRASFLARREPFYEFYIEILMERHEADPEGGFERRALEIAERFRARGLLDLLEVERQELRRAAGSELLELEGRLHRQMAERDRHRLELVRRGAPSSEVARLEREQRSLAMEYDQLRARLWARQPGGSPPPSLSSCEMTALLDDDTLLLVYSLGGERSFLWNVSSQGIRAHELASRGRIEELAQRAYSFLESSDQRRGQREGRQAIESLSTILLGPVSESLGHKRLLVMADGRLHYLPFAALVGASGQPLVADHEIVSLPSASVLKALRDRAAARSPAPKALAVMADPVFRREDPRFHGTGVVPTLKGEDRLLLPDRLERSGQEAAAILALVAPQDRLEALGFDATREAILDGRLAEFRIVHIATHGELNDGQPEYTHLVLSLLDRQGHSVEGRLYQHELGSLDLPADLVVLSACNSALGKHVRGEGLVGMTRGFLDAGATRVLVSLWFVSDEATALLMERFYVELLVEGKTPPAALQAAQLWLQSFPQWRSPFYWAGFVLQGEWR